MVILDGSLYAPDYFLYQKTIIRGDQTEPLISLASIAAKVTRDRKMVRLSKKYPQYNFHIHKGYGTPAHRKAIKKFGLSEVHRRSFLRSSV
jgi:ribonuclease HII